MIQGILRNNNAVLLTCCEQHVQALKHLQHALNDGNYLDTGSMLIGAHLLFFFFFISLLIGAHLFIFFHKAEQSEFHLDPLYNQLDLVFNLCLLLFRSGNSAEACKQWLQLRGITLGSCHDILIQEYQRLKIAKKSS